MLRKEFAALALALSLAACQIAPSMQATLSAQQTSIAQTAHAPTATPTPVIIEVTATPTDTPAPTATNSIVTVTPEPSTTPVNGIIEVNADEIEWLARLCWVEVRSFGTKRPEPCASVTSTVVTRTLSRQMSDGTIRGTLTWGCAPDTVACQFPAWVVNGCDGIVPQSCPDNDPETVAYFRGVVIEYIVGNIAPDCPGRLFYGSRPSDMGDCVIVGDHGEREGFHDFLDTPSPTVEETATWTATPKPSATASPLPSSTLTATATSTATRTVTPSPRPSSTPTNTSTPRPTATATPTASPTKTPTATPSPIASSTPRATPTPTATPPSGLVSCASNGCSLQLGSNMRLSDNKWGASGATQTVFTAPDRFGWSWSNGSGGWNYPEVVAGSARYCDSNTWSAFPVAYGSLNQMTADIDYTFTQKPTPGSWWNLAFDVYWMTGSSCDQNKKFNIMVWVHGFPQYAGSTVQLNVSDGFNFWSENLQTNKGWPWDAFVMSSRQDIPYEPVANTPYSIHVDLLALFKANQPQPDASWLIPGIEFGGENSGSLGTTSGRVEITRYTLTVNGRTITAP